MNNTESQLVVPVTLTHAFALLAFVGACAIASVVTRGYLYAKQQYLINNTTKSK